TLCCNSTAVFSETPQRRRSTPRPLFSRPNPSTFFFTLPPPHWISLPPGRTAPFTSISSEAVIEQREERQPTASEEGGYRDLLGNDV
ncbi:unnamed protein product, partial [Musa hybrid cultivar]